MCKNTVKETSETVSGDEHMKTRLPEHMWRSDDVMFFWFFGDDSRPWQGCCSCTCTLISRHLWGTKDCITHNPMPEQKSCFFYAFSWFMDQVFCVSTGLRRPSTPGPLDSPTFSASAGRSQREAREPRAASSQLSRLPLCVTGSWKRSCGSSCSLADERLQR